MSPLRAFFHASLTLVGLSTGFALMSTTSQELSLPRPGTGSRVLPMPNSVRSTPYQGAAADQSDVPGAIPRNHPLGAIPLTSLTATRERPLFSPSRRAPAAIIPLQAPISPVAMEPARPLLALVGAIATENGGVAIFLDETTKGIVRLRTGEAHSGWILRLVKGREVTMQKGGLTAKLALPVPSTQ
jgi:general secretion pathway protein N